MKKIIYWITITVCSIAVFILFAWDKQVRTKNSENLKTAAAKEKELKRELEELNKQLEELDNKKKETQKGIGKIALIFTGLKEYLYTDAFSLMKGEGYKGVLVISEQSMPGMKGCLSWEQFREMITNGWEYVVELPMEGNYKQLLANYREAVKEWNLGMPQAVFMDKYGDADAAVEFMKNSDYKTLLHHGEEDRALVTVEFSTPVFLVGCMGYNEDNTQEQIQNAAQEGGCLALEVHAMDWQAEDETIDFDRQVMDRLFSWIKNNAENYTLTVDTVSAIYKQEEEETKLFNEYQNEYQVKRDAVAEEIETLKQQIAHIYVELD